MLGMGRWANPDQPLNTAKTYIRNPRVSENAYEWNRP